MKFTLVAVVAASILSVQAFPHPMITPAPNPLEKREDYGVCPPHTTTATPDVCPAIVCPSPTVACPLIIRVTQVPCYCKYSPSTVTTTAPCCTTECIVPTETVYTGCPTKC